MKIRQLKSSVQLRYLVLLLMRSLVSEGIYRPWIYAHGIHSKLDTGGQQNYTGVGVPVR